MGLSAFTHAQTVIDMYGRTINSSLNYGWTEAPAKYLFYDSTLSTGRILTFDSARFTGANFNNFTVSSDATMRMHTWGEFVGAMNNFTNMNIYGVLDPSGIGAFSNVSFSGTKVYGTFSIDSLNGAVTGGSVLFENMLFDINSRFYLSSGNFTSGASFDGTEVRGNFTLGTGNYSNIKMTNMLFTDASVFSMSAQGGIAAAGADFSGSQFLGSVKISASMNIDGGSNPAKFNNTTVGKDFAMGSGNCNGISFRGAVFNEDSIFTIASSSSGGIGDVGADFTGATGIMNASQANFTDAKFKAGSSTTFNNGMDGASFLRTRFESGSCVKMNSTDLADAEFDGILIQNNATLYMDSAAAGIRLVNSTMNAGGKLTVTSDGWVRDWSNAVIENNNFAGDVFFGVTEEDNRDYNSLTMTGASFAGTTFGCSTNFRWVNLSNASLKNTTLGGNGNSNVNGVSFSGAEFEANTTFNFYGANPGAATSALNFPTRNSAATRISPRTAAALRLPGQTLAAPSSSTTPRATAPCSTCKTPE